MADPRQDTEEADARVAAAKARLMALSVDTRPGYHLMLHASNLVRQRPWQGVGLALALGVALGMAPREALRRVSLMAPIALRLLTGGGAGERPRTSVGVERPR